MEPAPQQPRPRWWRSASNALVVVAIVFAISIVFAVIGELAGW